MGRGAFPLPQFKFPNISAIKRSAFSILPEINLYLLPRGEYFTVNKCFCHHRWILPASVPGRTTWEASKLGKKMIWNAKNWAVQQNQVPLLCYLEAKVFLRKSLSSKQLQTRSRFTRYGTILLVWGQLKLMSLTIKSLHVLATTPPGFYRQYQISLKL